MTPIKIALVGDGGTASVQHLPCIADSPHFELLATVSSHGGIDGFPCYRSIEELLLACRGLQAVALCMPPQARHAAAHMALNAGLHVLMEKPGAATVAEVMDLEALARRKGVTLFACWNARFAPAIAFTKAYLLQYRPRSVHIRWKESVRRLHIGQDSLWQSGKQGVFAAGIDALSIMTQILPFPVFLKAATLTTPSNCHAPIAADLRFEDARRLPVHAVFDWRASDEQCRDIVVQTEHGILRLADSGARLWINGAEISVGAAAEYPALYSHFFHLIASRQSDVDLFPLQHVADAFMIGRPSIAA